MRPILEFDWRRAAIVRMLLYPIQFDSYPMEGIDRVLARDVFSAQSKLWLHDVESAIEAGLTSKVRLSELIPMSHSEEVIRNYLATLRSRLVSDRSTEASRRLIWKPRK